ncbi:MAG TPA: guanylate kinase [Acidobacteriota bacterium]|nr:guanylate kinase [Acidobacteriota bacterium]HRR26764.1 guanylate kinase [Acidobacteriota bacterium]HRR55716.1 guanylate kinase [Acidobacteriota bacterium]HRV07836.1 guanylate kinase [Acidobacteriota bacterium]
MSSNGELFVVSSPSGAGKSTLIHRVLDQVPQLVFSVSYTTRPARDGEVHGRDYFFVSEKEFEERIARNDFLEWAEVYGYRYGTSREFVEDCLRDGKDVILDIDVQGARQVRENCSTAVLIFVLPPSRRELEDRLKKRRSDSEEAIRRRLAAARSEIERYREYNYVIINREVDPAVEELKAVVLARRCRVERRREAAEAVAATFRE